MHEIVHHGLHFLKRGYARQLRCPVPVTKVSVIRRLLTPGQQEGLQLSYVGIVFG